MTIQFAFQLLFIGCMVWAAATDLYTFRIFNSLILVLLAAFAVFAAVSVGVLDTLNLASIGWHALAALCAFALFLIFYIIGQMGAGDVKLIGATVLWLGWSKASFDYVLYSLIAGGVLTIMLLIWRRFPLPHALARVRFIKRLHIRRLKTPYGITLGGVAIWASFQAPIFQM